MLRPKAESFELAPFLSQLASLVRLLPDRTRRQELEEAHQQLTAQLDAQYNSFQTRQRPLHDMAATLLERFSYLVSDSEWTDELDGDGTWMLHRLASFLDDASRFVNRPLDKDKASQAELLVAIIGDRVGRVPIFCRSIAHGVDFMLHLAEEGSGREDEDRAKSHAILSQLRFRLSPDSFGFRLALRLAIVISLSHLTGRLLPLDQGHWIMLNAFLLLQPSSEESTYRMRTRPIGTLLGCILQYIAQPFLPTLPLQLAFALVMTSLMYMSRPGTWHQPIFATAYALTMTTMTIERETAIALRIFHLAAAIVIVWIVNRFFLPMTRQKTAANSFKALFRLNNSYWDIIKRAMLGSGDLAVSSSILALFHMYWRECMALIGNGDERHRERMHSLMLILWQMFSELEQIHYLVRIRSVQSGETERVLSLIAARQKDIYPVIRAEDLERVAREAQLQRSDISYVLSQYIANARLLLDYREDIPF